MAAKQSRGSGNNERQLSLGGLWEVSESARARLPLPRSHAGQSRSVDARHVASARPNPAPAASRYPEPLTMTRGPVISGGG